MLLAPHFAALEHGPLHRFADWPNRELPQVAAGVYTIWREASLIYAGHAGRAVAGAREGHRTGLADRLHHHASGRRSGDQFCVYVCDRLVLQTLRPADLAAVAAGALLLDDYVHVYVRDHLTYRETVTPTVAEARAVEDAVRGGALTVGAPFLNPLPALVRPPREVRCAEIRARDV